MPRLCHLLTLCLLLFGAVAGNAESYFTTNTTWRFLPGTNEASLPDKGAWRQRGYDDGQWLQGAAPFYFDTGAGASPYTGNTLLGDMQGNYNVLFLRKTFTVTRPEEIYSLKIRFQVDDGFVLWINGVRLTNQNVSASAVLNYNTTTSTAPEPPAYRVMEFPTPRPATYLVEGENVVAVQLFNATRTDNDLYFHLSLDSTTAEATRPVITSVSPAPGAVTQLTKIVVTFSEPVIGVDAADLLVNGSPCDTATQAGNAVTFTFPTPVPGPVQITWDPDHDIIDSSPLPNSFDSTLPSSRWSYSLTDVAPPTVASRYPLAGATLRSLSEVEIRFSETVAGVDAGDLLINGLPASTVVNLGSGLFRFTFPPPAPGTITLAWKAGHGITDTSASALPFTGGGWSYVLNPSAVVGDLVVSEFLAANASGLLDEDGEPQAWIEIWNRGSGAVNLSGWSLSDDSKEPGQWMFPGKTLPAGQRMVVFASGKDRTTATGTNRFHTNFRLAQGGEFLGLYTPESPRVLASGFSPSYPEQRNDHSYGLDPAGLPRYFSNPTPGQPNSASAITSVVEPVVANVQRGLFSAPFTLELGTPTPGAVIRYTTDGSEPTATSGRIFYQPVRITNTTLIRAAAYRTNLLPSRVTTHSYFFNLNTAAKGLPILSITTASNNLVGPTGIIGMGGGSRGGSGEFIASSTNDYHNPSKHGIAWERPISAELIRPEDNSGFQIDCGLRVQGSDWQRPRTTPESKFSFRMYFRSDYGYSKLRYPFMPDSPVHEYDQIVLRAGFNDPDNPFLRDELTRQLSDDMGMVASHGTFVNLFINGVYKGYYNPAERIEETTLQGYHGGGRDWDVVGQFGQQVDGDRVSFDRLLSLASTTNTATAGGYTAVKAVFDVENFIDYLLLNIYGAMGDWPPNNWRAAQDRTPGSLWRFYVWDAEWGMGYAGRGPTIDTFAESGGGPGDSGLSSSCEIGTLYKRLMLNPEFRLLWADRVHRHFFNNGALTDARILARFNEMKAQLAGVIPFMDTGIATTWIPQRRPFVMTLFNRYGLIASSNAPVFSQFGGPFPKGGSLTMTRLSGTIYYTLDGSDPREAYTGNVSPRALPYTAPLMLTGSTRVRARTFKDFDWSALTEADFSIDEIRPPLRITEIMADPPGGGALEFLELLNDSSVALDVSGFSFEGITFVFPDNTVLPPGARIVLASGSAPATFATRYPGVPVAGWFQGSLSNNGERLSILDRAGSPFLTVDYRKGTGWPQADASNGMSLEIRDPEGDPDSPANWRASSVAGGTPGKPPSPAPATSVFLNEVMAHNISAVPNGGSYPDWVELINTGDQAANIGGWSLSQGNDPKQYVLPAGTTLPAGGRLVVWCDSAPPGSGLHSGFTLKASGDHVGLHNASGVRVDAVGFGLQAADYSIGRINGAWVLTLPTPAAENQAADVAGSDLISINEWLANPAPGQPDWIELYNASPSLPASISGFYLSNSNLLHRLPPLTFLDAAGFAVFTADEAPGPDHLDFKLSSLGGQIALSDDSGRELQRVSYARQIEGLSRGRVPDGSANITTLGGLPTPGAPNYQLLYSGPVFTEFMARSLDGMADWIELFNPSNAPVSLAGFGLGFGDGDSADWLFPLGTTLGANAYMVVVCDPLLPASFLAAESPNTGLPLSRQSGTLRLFNPAGQQMISVPYGFQLPGVSSALISNRWQLAASPTPGAPNSPAAPLGSVSSVRLNEWMANPSRGSDWIELYNPGSLPVALADTFLSDDPTLSGTNKHRIAPLTFIGPGSWVVYQADGNPDAGFDHLRFNLNATGESLRFLNTNGLYIDGVDFGPQSQDVTGGRLPDASTNTGLFARGGTPESLNHQPWPPLEITEIFLNPATPAQNGFEVFNAGPSDVDLGGAFLTDDPARPRKYRFPSPTLIPGGGRWVVRQEAFSDGTPATPSLRPAWGGGIWILESGAGDGLTGRAVRADFGPVSEAGSLVLQDLDDGRYYLRSAAQTPGAPNSAAAQAPLVISELMVDPSADPVLAARDEYIELHNPADTGILVAGFVGSESGWRLRGGVQFDFPTPLSIPAHGHALLVRFNPAADAADTAAFRTRYGLGVTTVLAGPYQGRLGNSGDVVTLERRVPSVPSGASAEIVDAVSYTELPPWPSLAPDPVARALHRASANTPGQDPFNWFAGVPTPGTAAPARIPAAPVILAPPASVQRLAGEQHRFEVDAFGAGTLRFQWRHDGLPIAGATNSNLLIPYVQASDRGLYDVLVMNSGGAVRSAPAELTVVESPRLVLFPTDRSVRRGTNVVLQAAATGTGPLSYAWSFEGMPILGETGPSLTLANVQVPAQGVYQLKVSSPYGSDAQSMLLTVLAVPVFQVQPQPLVALEGQNVRFEVVADGNNPITYRWQRGTGLLSGQTGTVLQLNAITLAQAGNYSVVASNVAGRTTSQLAALIVYADADRDGLPDAWETRFGLNPGSAVDAALDSDGDGLSNREEYLAGSLPNDASSLPRLRLLSLVATQATLQFLAPSNRLVSVETRPEAAEGLWTPLQRYTTRSTNRTETLVTPLSPGDGSRFYRLRIEGAQ